MAAIIPDIIIIDTLEIILKVLRDDYIAAVDKDTSLLKKIFEDLRLERYVFFDQIVSILITTEKDPDHIKVNASYDPERLKFPSIHVSLPSEQPGFADSLGVGEGDEGVVLNDADPNLATQYERQFNRGWNATYQIIIVSDNKNEILALYHLLKLGIVSTINHFELNGINNVKVGGMDLRGLDPSIPPGIFMRAITMSFGYESVAPGYFIETIINKINYTITVKQDDR